MVSVIESVVCEKSVIFADAYIGVEAARTLHIIKLIIFLNTFTNILLSGYELYTNYNIYHKKSQRFSKN